MCKSDKIQKSKDRFLQLLIDAGKLAGTQMGATSYPQIQKTVLRKSRTINGNSQYDFNFRLSANSQEQIWNDMLLEDQDFFYPIGYNIKVQEVDANGDPVGVPFPYTYPDKTAFGAASDALMSVYSGTWNFESDGQSIFRNMPSEKALRVPRVQSTADEFAEKLDCNQCCPLYNSLALSGLDTIETSLRLGFPADRTALTAGDKRYVATFELCGWLYRGQITSGRVCDLSVA